MAETIPNLLFSSDPDERHRAFIEMKESGEQMVQRLRDWEPHDIVWGWDVRRPNGGTMGKTFRRGDESRPAHEQAQAVLENPPVPGAGGVVFVWCGRIESVITEGPDPSDPGEPPLKYAVFHDVQVYDSRFLREESER